MRKYGTVGRGRSFVCLFFRAAEIIRAQTSSLDYSLSQICRVDFNKLKYN